MATTATASRDAVAAAITAIAMVIVLVLVLVIIIGRVGWRGCRWLRGRRRSTGVEHRRSSRWPGGVQVDLL
jgi:hypothetical protein